VLVGGAHPAARSAAAAPESRIEAARIESVASKVTYSTHIPANLGHFFIIFSMFPTARNTSYIATDWSPASIT
jgi:hypothetical protein